MKKESVKKQIDAILGTSEEVFQSKGVSDFKVTSGNFKGWYAAKIDDEENRREMEEHLRKRAAAVARGHVISRAEVERRSNNFQKALAYIGEHRHLVPLLVYVYNKSQGTTVNYWKLAKDYAKKNGGMPAELIDNGERKKAKEFDMCRTEDFYNAVAQVPSFPKAWLK